jgi:hypothetical protein
MSSSATTVFNMTVAPTAIALLNYPSFSRHLGIAEMFYWFQGQEHCKQLFGFEFSSTHHNDVNENCRKTGICIKGLCIT